MINTITWKQILTYFTGKTSLFRANQTEFLQQYGALLEGHIIEVGCEKHYNHQRYLTNVTQCDCTNIGGDYDTYLDITDTQLPDDSVDGYLCLSVIEHVPDFQVAIEEIKRTLKPGGVVLFTVPFLYPMHDVVDYWRVAPDAWGYLLKHDFDITIVHLGGKFGTLADLSMRPRGNLKPRHLVTKIIGVQAAILSKLFEAKDKYPAGIGIIARKQ